MNAERVEQAGRKVRRVGAWLTAAVWGIPLAIMLLSNPVGWVVLGILVTFVVLVRIGRREQARQAARQ